MINITCSKKIKCSLFLGLLIFAVIWWFIGNEKVAVNDRGDSWHPIIQQPIVHTIVLNGRIEPNQRRYITSPFTGEVSKIHFRSGQHFLKGDKLVELDASTFESELLSAEIAKIKAHQAVHQVKNFSTSVTVMRAKRSINNNEKALNLLKKELNESNALFERGIIARNEVDSLKQQVGNLEMQLISARNELEELLQQGGAEELQLAEIELASADVKLKMLEQQRDLKVITAPFTGVVLPIENYEDDVNSGPIQQGSQVEKGQALFQMVSTDQLVATAQVAESDLQSLRIGMKVTLKGMGFKGFESIGKLIDISYLPSVKHGDEQAAMFPIVVKIDDLNDRQQQFIRPGMSVQITIETYRNDRAVIVLPQALIVENGKSQLRYRQSAQDQEQLQEVIIGHVVSNGVEIFGVESGEIWLPEPH